jgi:hypothetical protein
MRLRFFLQGLLIGASVFLGLRVYKGRKREMLERESAAAQFGSIVGIVHEPLFEIADGPLKNAVISDSQKWLALIDDGAIEGSWNNLSQLSKSFLHWEDYQQVTANFRSKRGGVYERVLKRVWYTPEWSHSPKGDYVGVEYESRLRFDRDRVIEFTVMAYEDGEWRVLAHQFRPLCEGSEFHI